MRILSIVVRNNSNLFYTVVVKHPLTKGQTFKHFNVDASVVKELGLIAALERRLSDMKVVGELHRREILLKVIKALKVRH